MKWNKYSDAIPPLGKPVVLANPYAYKKFIVAMVGYCIEETGNEHYRKPMDEKKIKQMDGYWLELPDLPEEKS